MAKKKKRKTKTNKRKQISMIKSSNKNILKKAKKLEQKDPIIIKYSSSNKNTIKKTKFLKYKMKYNTKYFKYNKKPKTNIIIKTNDKEREENKGWVILAYICAPYVYLMKRDSKYINYHIKEGMKIFYLEVSYLILYYLTKNTIKTPTSCDNFAHYSFTTVCKAMPWWVTFIWALIALALVFKIVELIKNALTDDKILEEVAN